MFVCLFVNLRKNRGRKKRERQGKLWVLRGFTLLFCYFQVQSFPRAFYALGFVCMRLASRLKNIDNFVFLKNLGFGFYSVSFY